MLYGIGQHDIKTVWPEVAELIGDAAQRSRGKYTGADIHAALLSTDAQLWIWKTPTAFGVLVTQIVTYPGNKCCWIRIATGHNAREWGQPAVARIEQYAKAVGCNAMELVARPGWERLLSGYDKTHVYLEKQL